MDEPSCTVCHLSGSIVDTTPKVMYGHTVTQEQIWLIMPDGTYQHNECWMEKQVWTRLE